MKLTPYKSPPGARTVATVIFCCSAAVRLVLALLEIFAGLSIAGKLTLPLLNTVVLVSFLFVIQKKRVLFYAITGALLVANTALLLIGNDGAEYYFSSPQGVNTLVIREKSALVSAGWADLYRLRYGVMKQKLDLQVGTDDNYQPFSHGQYRLEWVDEDTASLEYYNGHGYQKSEINL